MSVEGHRFYPGDTATPPQLLQLADEYRRAAEALLPTGRRRAPLSRAPYRLVAIQAIELYLNAFLLDAGHAPCSLRGLQHDLAKRTRLALDASLVLRKRTIDHLESLSRTREYLVTRYDPTQPTASQLNRLAATLSELSDKVNSRIKRRPPDAARVAACSATV